MGKRKINILRGKRLVTGDPNLVTMNEIHVKDTSKGVEITERDKNGKLVNINMPSGEGDTPSGGNIEYLDVSEIFANPTNPNIVGVLGGALSVKITFNEMLIIAPIYYTLALLKDIQAVATNTKQMSIDWSTRVVLAGESMTILELCLTKLSQEEIDAIPRITKEEFYSAL